MNCRGNYPGWHHEPPPPATGPRDVGEHWESGQRGAILYRDREGRGPHAFFNRDVPDLDRTRFGSRMASSIDVSPGCLVTLYELPGYRGRRTEFQRARQQPEEHGGGRRHRFVAPDPLPLTGRRRAAQATSR